MELRLLLAVLVVVVVELVPRHDLSHDRGPRIVVAEHGALELPGVDSLLDQGSLVVAQGEVDRGREVLPTLHLRHADRGTAAGGLDEERESEAEMLFV